MIRARAIVASIALLAAAGPALAAPETTLPDEVAARIRAVADRPLAERIDAISQAFLGRPYLLDPLGEGSGPDPDPLFRYDAFDCLTYVEEVLALALARDPLDVDAVRLALRYGDAEPRYEHRRHFMELQWIPGNVASGRLRDTTAEYGPTTVIDREVTPETWRRWRGRSSFQLPDEALPTGPLRLEVLSIDDAIAAADRIRPGSLLLTVRDARSDSPVQVSHVGIVVPGRHPTVRHATKMSGGAVRDHGLRWYLGHLRTYTAWPVMGVAVLEPVEPGG